MSAVEQLSQRSRSAIVIGLVGAIALCWILLTPPGAGADEPSHLARAGAVARWEFDGTEVGFESRESVELPDSYLLPEPACYAIVHPDISTDCAPQVERSGALVTIETRADEYPPWPHLWIGAFTRLPGSSAVWWARLAVAGIASVLVGIALARRPRPVAAAGVLAALTPMAWATFSTINPSGIAIGGAIALWAGLGAERPTRADAWLIAAGWAALSLPRRDGLIWACLTIALVFVVGQRDIRPWWRLIHLGPRLLLATTTGAVVVWGALNESRVSRLVALSPIVLLGCWLAPIITERFGTTPRRRLALALSAALTAALGAIAAVILRPGGWDGEMTSRVTGQTGAHLTEAIGRLGWLDVPLPTLAIAGWVILIGVLLSMSLAGSLRPAAVAAATLTTAIVTSWVFELVQGSTSGRYWQGRYSLPLLVGIPIVLSMSPTIAVFQRDVQRDVQRRVAWLVGGGALLIVNVAAWAAARRWGVGTSGSLRPWDWGTHHSIFPPLALLTVHAIVSGTLALMLLVDRTAAPEG